MTKKRTRIRKVEQANEFKLRKTLTVVQLVMEERLGLKKIGCEYHLSPNEYNDMILEFDTNNDEFEEVSSESVDFDDYLQIIKDSCDNQHTFVGDVYRYEKEAPVLSKKFC